MSRNFNDVIFFYNFMKRDQKVISNNIGIIIIRKMLQYSKNLLSIIVQSNLCEYGCYFRILFTPPPPPIIPHRSEYIAKHRNVMFSQIIKRKEFTSFEKVINGGLSPHGIPSTQNTLYKNEKGMARNPLIHDYSGVYWIIHI